MKNYFLALSSLIILVLACNNNGEKKNSDQTKSEDPKINVPAFNVDSAFSYVEKQVAFGPRVPNSKAQEACATYFSTFFKSFADTVIVQESKVKAFDGTMLKMKNIIASFNPKCTDRIFLASHWDSRPFSDQDKDIANRNKAVDAANDGASGVGILMEIARLLKKNKTDIGLDLILFDTEDYGQPEFSKLPRQEDSWCLGSQYWAKNPHVAKYNARYGILLDMVGAKNATFFMEGISYEFASGVVQKVWDIAGKAGFSEYFIAEKSSEITDDHYYINTMTTIPCIDIIHHDQKTSSGFPFMWHTQQDKINNIDKYTLKAVGQTLLEVIFREKKSI